MRGQMLFHPPGLEAPNGSNAGNVDVSYPAPVDRVVITYSDVTSWTKKQFVGIHDLRWC